MGLFFLTRFAAAALCYLLQFQFLLTGVLPGFCNLNFVEQVERFEISTGEPEASPLSVLGSSLIFEGKPKPDVIAEQSVIEISPPFLPDMDRAEHSAFIPRGAEPRVDCPMTVSPESTFEVTAHVLLEVDRDIARGDLPDILQINDYLAGEPARFLSGFSVLIRSWDVFDLDKLDAVYKKVGPELSAGHTSGNLISLTRSREREPALLDRLQKGDQSDTAQHQLPGAQYNNPERPRGGVLLGGEIALILLGFPFGLGVGYQALRKSGDTSVVSGVLRPGLMLTGASLLSGY